MVEKIMPDVTSAYGKWKFDRTDGMVIEQKYEGNKPFIRGRIQNFVEGLVHRAHINMSVSEWFPFQTASIADVTMHVRFNSIDLTLPKSWMSFITVALSEHWERVVTTNYDLNSHLHMFHLPDQDIRQGQIRTGFDPILAKGVWHTIRNRVDLIAGKAEVYYGDNNILVESNTINNPELYKIWHFHFGYYTSGNIQYGQMDNKIIDIKLEQ